MNMKAFSLFFLLMLLCALPDITATRKLRKKRGTFVTAIKVLDIIPEMGSVISDVIKLWNRLLVEPDLHITNWFFRSKQENLEANVATISSKISSLEEQIKNEAHTSTAHILQAIPKILKLESAYGELTSIINMINFADDQLQEYLIIGYQNNSEVNEEKKVSYSTQNELGPSQNLQLIGNHGRRPRKRITKRAPHARRFIQKYTLEDFAAWATGHTYNSLRSLLRRLNDLTGASDGSIFHLMKEDFQETQGSICNLKESPHKTIYNLYVAIALAQLKGNTILQFSYMLLKAFNKGDFISEAELALQTYESYSKSELEVVRSVLSGTDRSFYKCDPKQHVSDVTYTKLTRLLQGYIENEVNLNPYGTCRENCLYYTFTEYNSCFKEQFCAHQEPCKGKVIECNYVDSDMTICTSSNPEKRYDWVKYKRGKTLGNTGVCQSKNLFKVDSWWRYLFWHCSYCLCLCDGGDDIHQRSDRYFNLREVTSDIHENKIVTGVRIVKNNRIIHIQIQQGILGPRAVVNQTSLSWKPVENYTIHDNNVTNEVDYHTMSWLERAVDIDEILGAPEHVLTGIRFRRIGTHLNLEIRVTPINFTTGEVLTAEHSYWLGSDKTVLSTTNPRSEIKLSEPDIPIRNGPHTLNSKHNQYIQFQSTSFKTDVGQSTVPYLDSQVLVSEGAPISGIGLIHRGKPGSGGFLALKIFTYDYTPHLQLRKN